MSRMKDYLAIIYGGGDEAVEIAQQFMGLSDFTVQDDEPRWIPVEGRLPEIGRRVLGFWMSHRGAVQSVRGAVGGWLDDDGNVTAPPTHWMPLPEPPEVK